MLTILQKPCKINLYTGYLGGFESLLLRQIKTLAFQGKPLICKGFFLFLHLPPAAHSNKEKRIHSSQKPRFSLHH